MNNNNNNELRDALIALVYGDPNRSPELRKMPVPEIDSIMSLIEQAVVEAQIDELKKVREILWSEDEYNSITINNLRLHINDRLPALQDNQGASNE